MYQQVPIHTLEEKVVALYFYNPDCPDSLTKELKSAYEEFAKLKKIFEVVLVYIREPCNNENCLEVEIEKLKGLNLGKLWNPEHVFKRTDGSQVSSFNFLSFFKSASYNSLTQTKFLKNSVSCHLQFLHFLCTCQGVTANQGTSELRGCQGTRLVSRRPLIGV